MSTEIAHDFVARVREIDWSGYSTAYGSAAPVADLLIQLVSEDVSMALEASHELWCALCHQHVYVTDAALPASPFIFEILDVAGDELKVELLDILLGFARCSHPKSNIHDEPWIAGLWNLLFERRNQFLELSSDSNREAADFARTIVEVLQAENISSNLRWGYDEGEEVTFSP